MGTSPMCPVIVRLAHGPCRRRITTKRSQHVRPTNRWTRQTPTQGQLWFFVKFQFSFVKFAQMYGFFFLIMMSKYIFLQIKYKLYIINICYFKIRSKNICLCECLFYSCWCLMAWWWVCVRETLNDFFFNFFFTVYECVLRLSQFEPIRTKCVCLFFFQFV